MSISILNRGASGGLKPELTVTAPSGSTIDIMKGSIIIDTYTLGASETEHTFVLKIGDYIVCGTLGTNTKSVEVVIDAVAQYELLIKYIDAVFANNTWETIIDACQNNNVPETWVVGDQKTMLINGTNYAIDIIGKNHDTYTAGGTAPLTFQMHDLYTTAYTMNSSNINLTGWSSSGMRGTNLPAFRALMPSEVQAGLKAVDKPTNNYVGGKWSVTNTSDKLFLLSEVEISGSSSVSRNGEGTRYAYYAANNSRRIKYRTNGSAWDWWTRSPCSLNETSFVWVNREGQYRGQNANMAYTYIAPAFCF